MVSVGLQGLGFGEVHGWVGSWLGWLKGGKGRWRASHTFAKVFEINFGLGVICKHTIYEPHPLIPGAVAVHKSEYGTDTIEP